MLRHVRAWLTPGIWLSHRWRARFRWKLHPSQVTGDTKYGTVENIVAIETQGIRAYVPLSEVGHRPGLFRDTDFTYDPVEDVYRCPGEATLTFISQCERTRRRLYQAPPAICPCALRDQCTTSARGRRIGRSLDEALASGSLWGITSVVFVAALRESLETVLFLLAVLLGTSPLDLGIGGVLGLLGAVALGYLIYHGGRRINLRLFFRVTGALVLVIAAGLFAKGIAWLQEAGAIPTFLWPVWNVEEVPLIGSGRVAQILNGLFGWNPRPSIEEVGFWLRYLLVVGSFFFVSRKPTAPQHRRAAPAG